jgi:hypothetical protein
MGAVSRYVRLQRNSGCLAHPVLHTFCGARSANKYGQIARRRPSTQRVMDVPIMRRLSFEQSAVHGRTLRRSTSAIEQ